MSPFPTNFKFFLLSLLSASSLSVSLLPVALPVGSRPSWDDDGGCGGDQEWEICNYNGFVYKRRRRPSDDADPRLRSPLPSSSRDREADRRRSQKKKILLSLGDKYRKELDQCEELSASLAQIAAAADPTGLPSDAPPPPPPPAPASTEVDKLLLQMEGQESILEKLSELCEYVDSVLDAEEERMAKSLTDLPVWGSPRCLAASLTSQ